MEPYRKSGHRYAVSHEDKVIGIYVILLPDCE